MRRNLSDMVFSPIDRARYDRKQSRSDASYGGLGGGRVLPYAGTDTSVYFKSAGIPFRVEGNRKQTASAIAFYSVGYMSVSCGILCDLFIILLLK